MTRRAAAHRRLIPTLALTLLALAAIAASGLLAPLTAEAAAPGTPSSVTLARADGTVTASWDAIDGATKYHVTYTTDGGASWHAPVADHTNVPTNTLTFDADNAKTYVVGVRAGNDHGWSGWRNSAASGPFTPPVPTPTPTPAPIAEAQGGAQVQQNASLAVTANWAVTLTLTGHQGNWWFRINWWGTCTAATGTEVTGIRGYTGGPHSVTAYSDSNCGTQIASATFTVTNPSLAATVTNDWSVDLTLSSGPNEWWFIIGWGTCTAATGTSFDNIRGYAPGTHIVVATSDSACSQHVATTAFTVPDTTLAATVDATDRSVDLRLRDYPGASPIWAFRIDGGTCTAASGHIVSNIRGYQAGEYVVKAYSDSGCDSNYEIAQVSFTMPAATLSTSVSSWLVDLTLANGPDNWWFRINSWGTCTQASGSTTHTGIGGYKGGPHSVSAYSDSGCNYHVASSSFTIPAPILSTAVKTGGAFDLTLTDGPANWWFIVDYFGTCTAATSPTVSNIAGYQKGAHVVWAYRDSACGSPIASLVFTIGDLTVSNVGVTTATLAIAYHSGDWYYMANAAPDNTCQGPVNAGTSTKDLASLSANTTYTYSAYSAGGCADTDKLAAAQSFTTLSSVSTLASTRSGDSNITSAIKQATAFTTGAGNTGGYVLKTVTLPLRNKSGSGGLTVTLHEMQGTNYANDSAPSDTVLATLSGAAPTSTSWANTTLTCSGSGCSLEAGKTYFIVASVTGNAVYAWNYATDQNQTKLPSDNGWNVWKSHQKNAGSNWSSWGDWHPAEIVFSYIP